MFSKFAIPSVEASCIASTISRWSCSAGRWPSSISRPNTSAAASSSTVPPLPLGFACGFHYYPGRQLQPHVNSPVAAVWCRSEIPDAIVRMFEAGDRLSHGILLIQRHLGLEANPRDILHRRKRSGRISVQFVAQRVDGLRAGGDLERSPAEDRGPLHLCNRALDFFTGHVVVPEHRGDGRNRGRRLCAYFSDVAAQIL